MPIKPVEFLGDSIDALRGFPASVRHDAGVFRVIYLAKLADAVYVLHCFQKKTQETSEKDIKLARGRFKELMRKQP